MFLDSIKEILDLYARLSFIWLILDIWVLEELFSVGPLMIVLDKYSFNKVLKLGTPPLGLQSRRRISRDQEQGTHGVHVA